MFKIIHYVRAEPASDVHECYNHLAQIHYEAGGQTPFVVTGRTRELVQDAAEKLIAEEAARWEKSRNNPKNQGVKVSPRKRREQEPMPPHAGAKPNSIAAAMDAMDALEEGDDVIDVIDPPAAAAAPEPQDEADEVI